MSHTPEPWTLNIGCGSKGYAGNYEIMEALTEEHDANARLISAAPELLAACKPVDEAAAMKAPFWESDWNPDADVEIILTIAECRAIRAAIAKAASPLTA